MHDRAWLSRPARAGVPAPQLQGDRAVGRPGYGSQAMAWRHHDRNRRSRDLSADRRRRSRGSEALRHAASRRRCELGGPHSREQPDGANGVSDRTRQAHQGNAGLSDELGAEFRRGAAAARFLPAHVKVQGGDTCQLEAGGRRHHRPGGVGRGGAAALSGRLEGRDVLYARGAAAEELNGTRQNRPGGALQAARVSSANIASIRSKSGTSGYSFIILSWQMTGLRGPKFRDSSACTTSGLTRTSWGKPWVSTAKCPHSSAELIACMTTMRVRPLARGATRPQAASKDINGTRRPAQAIVPRYQAGAPSIGVGAW